MKIQHCLVKLYIFHRKEGLNAPLNDLAGRNKLCYYKGCEEETVSSKFRQKRAAFLGDISWILSNRTGLVDPLWHIHSRNADFKGSNPWTGTQQLSIFWSLSLSPPTSLHIPIFVHVKAASSCLDQVNGTVDFYLVLELCMPEMLFSEWWTVFYYFCCLLFFNPVAVGVFFFYISHLSIIQNVCGSVLLFSSGLLIWSVILTSIFFSP